MIVELITDSDASDLPWNNLKDGIDPDLEVTEEIHSRLSEYVERYFEADISKVPTPALAEYGPESQYAANDGKIEQVNISEMENTDKPTKLWRFRKLRRAAKYHVLKEIIIDHEEHDKDGYEILENEAEVPAYRSLVEDRATDADELDSVSPARGKEVVDEVKELKKTIGKVSYLPESAPEQIVEKGFLSLEEIRNASVYELRRGVDGVGHRLAEKIKNRVEPTTTKKDILQHLSSLPSKNVDRVDEEVAKLYKQLLQEFKRLPRKRKIKNVIDEEENFPLLAEDGSFYPAQDLFIPDNTEIYEAFEESETITFAEVPDPSRVGEEDNQKMFKLLQKLGAESVENECEIEAFGEGEIEDFDTTPLDRLERTWDEVISEASTDIDIPEVEWVEETGTRYILEDKEQKVYSSEDSAYYSSETGCAYDPETNCLYITSKFTVDWNGLADVLGKGLDASKKKIGTILEKGAPGLEERAIDKIRKRLSDEFDEVVDVHDRKHYQGYDVQGCDIFAIGDERQYIEVKSRRTEDTGIRLIGREPDLAEDEKDDYYLWIVVFDEPDESPRFWRVSNPSNREYEPETAWRIRKSVWKEKGKQGILDE